MNSAEIIRTILRVLAAASVLAAAPLEGQSPLKTWTATPLATTAGFDVPECVVFHPASQTAFVSNISAKEDEYWSDHGRGFISRLSAGGKTETLRWLESTSPQPIHAPKGMCVVQDHLYFTANSRLNRCAINKGQPGSLEEVSIPGAKKLNDLATDGQSILVSDTEAGKVYRLQHGSSGAPVEIAAIEGVNGVAFHHGKIFAVSWSLHDVFEIQPNAQRPPRAFGLPSHFTNLDGIEVLEDGTFIVSDFMGNKVSTISADRKTVRTLIEIDTPADIGIDRSRNILYVPQFMKDRVALFQLERK